MDIKQLKQTITIPYPTQHNTGCPFNPELTDDIAAQFGDQIRDTLEQWGVCIISDFLPDTLCDAYAMESVQDLMGIEPELDVESPHTWTRKNTPYGPRLGMYQTIAGNFEVAWRLREHCYHIFKAIYGTGDLLTSVDGASVYPPRLDLPVVKDWAHVDSAVYDYVSYQGQIVLTDTSAAFRCTPMSHTIIPQMLAHGMVTDQREFNMIRGNCVDIVKGMLPYPELYQIPITAPKGSFILWKSQTIHSAMAQTFLVDEGSPLNNWRCVFYICMMPREQYSQNDINNIHRAVREGYLTNHTASTLFMKIGHANQKSENVRNALRQLNRFSQRNYIETSEILRRITDME